MLGDTEDNWFHGGAGADTLDGGTGIDTLSYQFDGAAVTVNLASTIQGGAGNDITIYNTFENLVGSTYGDTLTGNNFNNVIWGLDGADTLVDGEGQDTLRGGEGSDTIILTAGDTAADTVILELGSNDTITNFTTGEAIFDISLASGGEWNYFNLLKENRVEIDNSGANALIKVDGTTIGTITMQDISWSDLLAGGGKHQTGGAGSITGTSRSDVLIADAATTIINGDNGNDILSDNGFNPLDMDGGAGDDTFVLGDADNLTSSTINGGKGFDTLRLDGPIAPLLDLNLLRTNNTITNIEAVDLNGADLEIIEAVDIIAMTESGELYLEGNGGEEISLVESDWHLVSAADNFPFAENISGYSTYVSTDTAQEPALLRVNNALTVTLS